MMVNIGVTVMTILLMDGIDDYDRDQRRKKEYKKGNITRSTRLIDDSLEGHLVLPTAVKFVVLVVFLFAIASYFQILR